MGGAISSPGNQRLNLERLFYLSGPVRHKKARFLKQFKGKIKGVVIKVYLYDTQQKKVSTSSYKITIAIKLFW